MSRPPLEVADLIRSAGPVATMPYPLVLWTLEFSMVTDSLIPLPSSANIPIPQEVEVWLRSPTSFRMPEEPV
jgi:hypothetical protein